MKQGKIHKPNTIHPLKTINNMKTITITDDTYNKIKKASSTISSKEELQDVIKSIHEDLYNYLQYPM